MLGRVTIIGRPNVGKSSIFNMLSGHRIAIVSDIENTTRDVIEYQINDKERGLSYVIADSGGLNSGSHDEVLQDVRKRAEESARRSELIVFVVEYDKITSLDDEIARMLRKAGKPVIIVGNKVDNAKRAHEAYELLSYGFGDPILTSAAQNSGFTKLADTIVAELKRLGCNYQEENYDKAFTKVAIIGRPNVGKSSLVNAITGENRSMVRDMAGTTRDAIDTIFEYDGHPFVLIDTAGIRRSGKIEQGIEDWSVLRAERAITRCDIAVIVIDAFEGITAGDQHIVERALEEKKGIIIVMNKWDKVLAKPGIDKDTIMNRFFTYLKEKFDFLSYVTPLFTSAIDGKRVEEVLKSAIAIREERTKRVKTSVFNAFLEQITYQHVPTGNKKSHKPKIYYGSQVDIDPPRFVLSVNKADHFHFSYTRYLENRIREHFGFWGTPIEIELRSRESIYKDKKVIKSDNKVLEEISTEDKKLRAKRAAGKKVHAEKKKTAKRK